MGYSSWKTEDWSTYSTATASRSTKEIFSSRSLADELNPKGVIRESRDSDANPNSTAVIVGCDVTGSMGIIAEHLIRTGIGTFFEELLKRKPVTDPHMMIMGIGDCFYDTTPFQASQFEADLTIAKWLEKVFIEQGGGGNKFENYDMAYYFAYNHTSIDCFEKRGKKGYLFTIGDEQAPEKTVGRFVESIFGDSMWQDVPFKQVIEQAMTMYHCYHIMIAEGNYARNHPEAVKTSWRNLLGQNAIWLTDYTKLSETIVSLIEFNEGESKEAIVNSWSGDTSLVIKEALKDSKTQLKTNNKGVVVL